jgi:hypothetical protein
MRGILELYRQRAEETRRQQAQRERRVRLRVPAGVGRMNMFHLTVAPDGPAEMLESEAKSFLRARGKRVDPGRLLEWVPVTRWCRHEELTAEATSDDSDTSNRLAGR